MQPSTEQLLDLSLANAEKEKEKYAEQKQKKQEELQQQIDGIYSGYVKRRLVQAVQDMAHLCIPLHYRIKHAWKHYLKDLKATDFPDQESKANFVALENQMILNPSNDWSGATSTKYMKIIFKLQDAVLGI
jgi:hypothetical protein